MGALSLGLNKLYKFPANEITFHLKTNFFFSFDPDTTKISRLISPIASQMITEKEYLEMKNFTDTNSEYFSKSYQGVRRALESIEINSQWVDKNFEGITERLRKFTK